MGAGDLESDLYEMYNIQTMCILIQGKLYIRLSAHVYNTPRDFARLRDAILELTKETKKYRDKKGYRLPTMHWDLSPLADIGKEATDN